MIGADVNGHRRPIRQCLFDAAADVFGVGVAQLIVLHDDRAAIRLAHDVHVGSDDRRIELQNLAKQGNDDSVFFLDHADLVQSKRLEQQIQRFGSVNKLVDNQRDLLGLEGRAQINRDDDFARGLDNERNRLVDRNLVEAELDLLLVGWTTPVAGRTSVGRLRLRLWRQWWLRLGRLRTVRRQGLRPTVLGRRRRAQQSEAKQNSAGGQTLRSKTLGDHGVTSLQTSPRGSS